MKELRECTKLADSTFMVYQDQLEAGLTLASQEEIKQTRAKKRMHALLEKFSTSAADTETDGGDRTLSVQFLLSPKELTPDSDDPTRVGGIKLEKTELEGEAFEQRAAGTGEMVDMECGLVLTSIGYKSLPLEKDIPFDDNSATISHTNGRVEGRDGLFCAGWVKRGPSGIVGTNIADAKDTVVTLMTDAADGKLPSILAGCDGGLDSVRALILKRSGKEASDVVNWEEYCKINEAEETEGAKVGKPREKIIRVDQMLEAAHS
jgi:adrenodoxin-NADP+ reductase